MARGRRSIDTRQKILEVAETQFARKTYAGAHLQSIAEEVGVQKTALYYYFPSKGALYLAVLERMLEDFERTVVGVIRRDANHRERLEQLLDGLNGLLSERRNYSQILIRIFVDRAEVDLNSLQPVLENVIGAILNFYHEGVEPGEFR